jgi:uncharacterized protein (TIGR03083 family)
VEEAATALADAYGGVTACVAGLDDAEMLLPSGCAGWSVADVLYHLLGDARRALVAFATPAGTAPDVDYVSYWVPFRPGAADPAAVTHTRLVTAAAIAVGGAAGLVEAWKQTATAAARVAADPRYPIVATQGHALRVADFVATLATEAAIHHLDLLAALPDAPAPPAAPLRLVRRTLDGLLGASVPAAWDDVEYAIKGTVRMPLTDKDRDSLGPYLDRFRLLG